MVLNEMVDERVLEEMGISGRAKEVFMYIQNYVDQNNHPLSSSELNREIDLPRRTVHTAIQKLQEYGLIKRRLSLTDARSSLMAPIWYSSDNTV